jgi:predicted amidohydrolase
MTREPHEPHERRIRIAAAQSPVGNDPAANGAAIRDLMRTAAAQGARLIHFPEGALTGYSPTRGTANAEEPPGVDWAAAREQFELVAALAGELGLWTVLGGDHRLTGTNRPHNSLYILSDEGRPVGRYDKRLCSYNEIGNWYSPGAGPFAFDVDGFRFGCVLCIEVNFPELFLEYRADDVDCVLFSSYSEDPLFEVIARGHAAAHNSWISVSVPAQCATAVPAGVIGPHGARLADCPAAAVPALVCVDLDRADPALDFALHKARPWRTLSREGLVYRERRAPVEDDPRSTDRTSF